MIQTEVLVIGAGPGGYVGAIKLAQLGKKVLIVDKNKLGGECLNYGCIPSKALIAAANTVHKIKKAKDLGIEVQGLTVNAEKLQAWKSSLIGNLNRGIAGLLKGNGIQVMAGEAVFSGPKEARIRTSQGEEAVSFDQAVIATGSSSMEIPGFKIDGRLVIGSKEALELSTIPKSLVIIGGGVIGLEIGTFYAKLGAQVTVVELMPQLLPGIDMEFVTLVARSLEKLGVKIYTNTQALGFEDQGGQAVVRLKTAEGEISVTAEKILLSVGRKPNSKNLGLEAAGVQADTKGFIKVNERWETSASGIYAIGDVTPGPLLAHRSSAEGVAVAQLIARGNRHTIGEVPSAIFTDPEVAVVGLTQRQAQEKGIAVVVGKFPFAASGRALAVGEPDGFVKVVADQTTKKILGCGIVGPEASDLISEAALAVRLGATLEDVATTIHPHPTLPEAFLEACEAALGRPTHILPPRLQPQLARP